MILPPKITHNRKTSPARPNPANQRCKTRKACLTNLNTRNFKISTKGWKRLVEDLQTFKTRFVQVHENWFPYLIECLPDACKNPANIVHNQHKEWDDFMTNFLHMYAPPTWKNILIADALETKRKDTQNPSEYLNEFIHKLSIMGIPTTGEELKKNVMIPLTVRNLRMPTTSRK